MEYMAQALVKAFHLLIGLDDETYSAIFVTVKVSTISMIFTLIAGVPLGFALGSGDFRGKRVVRTFVDTLLAIPTVVVGLLVYAFISRRGPLGSMGLLFSLPGIAVGQFILAMPIVISLTATAVESLEEKLAQTLLTLGAGTADMIRGMIWEARYAVISAAVTAYGRVISEVGVSMMLGGNIKWHTRTITTAIALETGKGEFATGLALGIVLLSISFSVNIVAAVMRRRASL
jgi:tungstate transport system permease protein